ncbi:uncharacterized protein LOC107412869 [Ziziphus jujuba]|uniref:Uncharacterized protein LOC107412869 n=2 Tax=Ziziphus jujuba TaxID=326968 RepID=A0A6P3ZDJ2_ZIZJJ|nr:uncharacterized protein LOC107412869 [Ziziphus jujuba]KAH7536807.1 hypothetical protein FEM48_Zijuj03G0025600 [Ziziphus jujuba var. spinosa]
MEAEAESHLDSPDEPAISSDISSSDLRIVASPSPLERKIRTPLSHSFSASLTENQADKSPNCYDYAPVDKARMESSERPREADYSNLDDYFRQYYNIVAKSEGFTSFVDPTSRMGGGIRPCEVDEDAQEAADCAVQKHNSEGPSVIKLKRILKANRQVQVRSVYYITLEAADADGDGTTLYYETKVRGTSKPGRYKVEFFRPALNHIQ